MKRITRLKSIYLTLFLLCLVIGNINATSQQQNILIISSYTPLSRQTANAISEFMDEYKRLGGGESNVLIENLNCKSFIDIKSWKPALLSIFNKYESEYSSDPALIILIGQEVWSSYLSLSKEERPDVPVMCTQVSRNFIYIPDNDIDTQGWMPETYDFTELKDQYPQVKSTMMYNYDISANINLALHFYPETKNIVFLSDNSYGGVSLQALMRREMKKYPELNLQLLDGRQQTIYMLVDSLKQIPPKSVIFVGTWRVDKNDGYFMPNATYLMVEANGKVPAFTPTTVALGHWTLGGIIPKYQTSGAHLAKEAYRILNLSDTGTNIALTDNHFVADYNKVRELGLNLSTFDSHALVINRPQTFYEMYANRIWIIVAIIATLSVMLLCLFYYYYKLKLLNRKLERSEAELIKAKEIAEESNRLKSAFLANMSHEIRTPLNAIVGFTDVIAEGDLTVDCICEYNNIIKSNSMLLLRLINDILDLSRLDSDCVSLAIEDCDAIDICQRAISTIDISANGNNKYIFKTDKKRYILKTDSQRMQQVIINLLSNATKFTENGTITVGFDVDQHANMARFSVADTGCGIPLEKQKQVFERFEKLNEYAQGTGLGLAICKLIVEKSGGKIWVDSSYTKGAKFIFTVPINKKFN